MPLSIKPFLSCMYTGQSVHGGTRAVISTDTKCMGQEWGDLWVLYVVYLHDLMTFFICFYVYSQKKRINTTLLLQQ